MVPAGDVLGCAVWQCESYLTYGFAQFGSQVRRRVSGQARLCPLERAPAFNLVRMVFVRTNLWILGLDVW